ncbi:Carboxypeptidase regulatory-like domain-containing protein [Hymenobacter daecheongensis DSM 21074]|uniref:Carboxypeptidase regulatory-like domain-containing protein n=1 Tax=Hymenobacter daecheongensis DSM 21074 TaxID=1121955 RepID=A0A1M6MD62_9BACT|nr:carboxypeptidase regulatory-like domain-containing protein [Hymenobacter daecheongensis]SHJ81367.1 Carboxypeptidase regulatory-like domain-containing protein [Hymenobacter daecheongensis DSM 21074]
MTINRLLLLLLGFTLFTNSPLATAQGVTTAAMKGLITDAKGQPLPGATVLATHLPTGTTYGTATRDNGQYDLLNMRIGGPYELKVSFVGSQTYTESGIQLALGKTFESRIALSDGAQALSEVVVKGNRDGQINKDRTGASTNVSSTAIRTLPTISRSQEDFTRLTPQSNGLSFGGRNTLYNNFSLDGSIFNNSFGLDAPTPGGQTNSQPVSLDAIEQLEVSLAPFDVRQGGFTGAGVNAVTKSGTNAIKGTVYSYLRNENLIGEKVGDVKIKNPDLKFNQSGFALGGPIIKNKLFFFTNAEITRRDDPGVTFRPARDAAEAQRAVDGQADGVSRVLESDLIAIREGLRREYGYDPGDYQGFKYRTSSDKFLAKFDWNINPKNTFSLRYNYLRSFREQGPHPVAISPNNSTRVQGVSVLQYANSGYTINNNLNSVVGELNSRFGEKLSNKAQLSFSAFRDFRELPDAPLFPQIDITRGGTTYVSFGTEQFSAENTLDQNITQFTDNLSYFAGAHVLTAGLTYERFAFVNAFNLQRHGYPYFGGITPELFLRTLTPGDPLYKRNAFPNRLGVNVPLDLNELAQAGGRRPVKSVDVNVAQLGLYLQDEWTVNPAFKLTLGVRADMPIYDTEVEQNQQIADASFLDSEGKPAKVDLTRFPKATPLWSPRLGFNYSAGSSDYTTQVRGGTGIFTGRIPFVWISNQASNSKFDNEYTFQINGTARDFKFPQVWRSNLAIDQQLPGGIVATVEGIYSKDINAAIHRNYNLVTPTARAAGADNRLIYPAAGPRITPGFTGPEGGFSFLDAGVIVLENTKKGYQYSLTGQLKKDFANGLYLTTAYTYSQAKDVTSNPGEIAGDAFQRNPVVGNANQPQLAYSDFGLQHRIIGAAGKRFSYADDKLATTLSFFFEAAQGNRFTYTYAGDMNRDGVPGNDLIFVPASQDQIRLVDITRVDNGGNTVLVATAAQQWQQLNAYIAQDKYLSTRRGQYAERNGNLSPWYTQLDAKLLQDFSLTANEKKHTFQLSFDIQNLGNLISSDWGVRKAFANNRPITFAGYQGTTDIPTYQFRGGNQTFVNNTDLNSRWRAQLGLRYILD